jgi:hypothetical protein
MHWVFNLGKRAYADSTASFQFFETVRQTACFVITIFDPKVKVQILHKQSLNYFGANLSKNFLQDSDEDFGFFRDVFKFHHIVFFKMVAQHKCSSVSENAFQTSIYSIDQFSRWFVFLNCQPLTDLGICASYYALGGIFNFFHTYSSLLHKK